MSYLIDDDELLGRICRLRRDVRLRDARPNDGRCGNVAAALDASLGWEKQWGYLKLLDGTVSWVHCWNRMPDGTIIDATADQYHDLWLGDVVAVPPGDPHAAHYRNAPPQWELRFDARDPSAILCSAEADRVTLRAQGDENPWPSLAAQVLKLLTGWDLHDGLVMLAARTLRGKAQTGDFATTEELVRPLLTEHIEHLARHRGHTWIANEFAAPI